MRSWKEIHVLQSGSKVGEAGYRKLTIDWFLHGELFIPVAIHADGILNKVDDVDGC